MNKQEYNDVITLDNAKKYYSGMYKDRNLKVVEIINNTIKNNYKNTPIKILDLAAGSAQIAELLLKENNNIIQYVWNDFADNVISYAKTIINDERFIINTDDCMNIKGNYDIVICNSLEHILDDIKLLNNFSDDTFFCICSPNFNSKGHYRFFNNVNKMINRYSFIFRNLNYSIIKCTNKKSEKYLLYGYKQYEITKLIQNNNFKSSSQLNTMYDKQAYNYLESDNFSQLYKFISENTVESVLDVGCWTGILYKHIKNKNIEYIGFDLCKKAISQAVKLYNNSKIFFVNDIYNIINKHVYTVYFGGLFYYINDNNKLSFIQKYIEVIKPKRIIIQDLQQTNLKMLEIYNPKIFNFKLNYKGLNIERLERQVLIIDL